MVQTPGPGEIYRHFKNKLYQVIAVAHHTETGEELVVYQALYGTYGVYARPLAMFMEKVDTDKYPDAKQVYRFEQVERQALRKGSEGVNGQEKESPDNAGKNQALNSLVLSFVETVDLDVKLEILSAMEEPGTQKDLDMICESLDLPKREGDMGGQFQYIRQYLEMRRKFDGKRLR